MSTLRLLIALFLIAVCALSGINCQLNTPNSAAEQNSGVGQNAGAASSVNSGAGQNQGAMPMFRERRYWGGSGGGGGIHGGGGGHGIHGGGGHW
ncbi:hypothetical protein niasHS_005464 [Heterodera schachtii]|uniref:Uncharacterized protein n=1 Tax=Heterodera schachtii TaxID=97005 RepID=A0ABD2JJ05_HETSC